MGKKYFKPFLTNCRSCNKPIAMLKTVNNKNIPVNRDSLTFQEIEDIKRGINFFFDPHKHISHFADCPQANEFRKKKESDNYKNAVPYKED